MEEKERYKLNSFDDIYDNEFDDYLLEDFQTSQLQNIVDLLNQQNKRIKELKEENKKLKKLLNNKILLAEDGSVDVDKLEEDGFYVIVYRQGAKPPMWLTHQQK